MKKTIVSLCFLFVVESLALNDWNFAVAEILPGSGDLEKPSWVEKIESHGEIAESDLIVDYEENNFNPYVYCLDIVDDTGKNFKKGVFHVVSLAESLENAKQDLAIDRWHWMLIYTMSYTITCGNKITYKGIFKWRNQLWTCKTNVLNGGCDDNPDTEQYDLDVSKYDYSTNTFESHRSRANEEGKNVVPIEHLVAAWNGRKVEYPEWKYLGEPGKKLAKPVLFVHGLGDDYKSWGVIPTVDADELCKNDADCAVMWPSICDREYPRGSLAALTQSAICSKKLRKAYDNYREALLRSDDSFQKGVVKKYNSGSAPDIIARNQNIYVTDENINNDGLYFFQAPGKINDEKRWEEAPLEWDNADAQTSQSRKLYQKLEEILDDFFEKSPEGTPINWRETPEATVDIVAHSQGGLVVREMLRGLRAENASTGCDNPANHIGRVVTVDTPHLGASTAAEDSKTIGKYPGLGKIIDDLNNPENHNLARVKVSFDYTDWLTDLGIFVTGSILGPLNTVSIITSDYEVNMNGSYLGPYTITLNVDPLVPGSLDFDIMDIDPLEDSREQAIHTRNIGKHLYSESDFMRKLNNGTNGVSYPKKPDGNNLEIVPLYSGNTKVIVSAALEKIAENLKISCPELDDDDSKVACVSLESYLESKSSDFEDKAYSTIDIDDIDLDQELINILNSLVDDWLANSDLIVDANSQMYESAEFGISSSTIPELKVPRKFEFHDALAPWETVAHLDLKMGDMAASARQGLDIACALYCDELLAEKSGTGLIYLNDGSVALTGDFDLSPLYLGAGKQGSSVADGTSYLEAIYEYGVGSYVNYTDAEGNLQHDVVVSSDIATNPRIRRSGSIVTVSFDNQSGKSFSKDYAMPNMSLQTTFSIISDEGAPLPKVVVGVGSASDLSSQVAPVSPTAWKKNKGVFVMHREARGDYESNTSRPRILVANSTDKDIKGFKVAYYFTADPARNPRVEVDYPEIPVVFENLGGDQWRFVLDATDAVLKAKSVFPSLDGWQIRLYYNDWADFDHLDDWSADYNIGLPQSNKKIVVYDVSGHILWGQEPQMFKSVDDGVIASPKGVLSWNDSAPWEENAFKPQVTVKNTGSIALKDYHAKLWFRVPDGKTLYVPTDDWYTPVSKPSLKNVGENVWELDMNFDTYMLYPNESVVEGNVGLHLIDWSSFDKTVCGIALLDSDENVIFGKVPSVDECKSYNLPSLLNVQYVWRI